MNPAKQAMIEDNVFNDKPISGAVMKGWLRDLLQENQRLRLRNGIVNSFVMVTPIWILVFVLIVKGW